MNILYIYVCVCSYPAVKEGSIGGPHIHEERPQGPVHYQERMRPAHGRVSHDHLVVG